MVWPAADSGWIACDEGRHEWEGEIQRESEGRRANPESYGKASQLSVDSMSAKAGAFCRRCAAWCGQLGLEPTIALYLDHLMLVMAEVWRVLRRDGTCWVNLGDSYAGSWGNSGRRPELDGTPSTQRPKETDYFNRGGWDERRERPASSYPQAGLKPKDLCLIPQRFAIRCQEAGWFVRSEIVWAKRAPMPESVTDRPTSATEKIYLLSKSASYFYDADAVREESITNDPRRPYTSNGAWEIDGRPQHQRHGGEPREGGANGRNLRNFWLLGPEPYPEAHFATFPSEIPRRAIMAGTSERGCCAVCGAPWRRVVETSYALERRDKTLGWQPTCAHTGSPVPATVLDPFGGSCATGQVAESLGRRWVALELAEDYIGLGRKRTAQRGLFT